MMADMGSDRHGASHLYGSTTNSGGQGGGEDMMQSFIRHYMMSILTPLSENVRQLQDTANKLAKDLVTADEKGNQAESRLDNMDQKLAALWASLAHTNSRLDATQSDLGKTNEEKAKLERAHDATKASLSEHDKRGHTTAMSLQDLWQRFEESNRVVHKVQDGLSEVERQLLEKVHPGIAQLNEFHDRLNFKHLEHVKAHEETRQTGESTVHALRKLMKAYEQQRKEDLDSFHHLNGVTRDLQSEYADVDRRVKKLTDGLTAANSDMQHMRAGLEHTDTNLHTLRQQQSEMSANLKDLSSHLNQVDSGLTGVKKDLAEEAKHIQESLRKLDSRITDNTSDIVGIDKGHKRHADQLQELDRRATNSEHRQLKFGEWADTAQRDITGLHTFQKHATHKLETHAMQQDVIQTRLQMASKGLEATNAHLNTVKGDLANTSETLAKQGGRVDLAHKYFSGISKGFQDTHRSLAAGEAPLLLPQSPTMKSPSNGNSKMLPSIASSWNQQTPRSTTSNKAEHGGMLQ